MELTQIRSFLEVARSGSVTRAAEQVGMTQPAVTQHLQNLEREFGAALFDRTARGMRLTSAGRALHRPLQDALAMLDSTRPAVEAAEAGVSGHVTLGSAVSLDSTGIATCIGRLHRDHPGIALTIRIARSEMIAALLLEGQIDLGIASMPFRARTLRATPLFEQRFVLACPGDHPLANRLIRHKQAAQLQMVVTTSTPWVGIDNALIETRTTRIETDTLESMKSLVEAGVGCAILPRHEVESQIQSKRLSEIRVRGVEMPVRTVTLMQRKDLSLPTGARALSRLLIHQFQPAQHHGHPRN